MGKSQFVFEIRRATAGRNVRKVQKSVYQLLQTRSGSLLHLAWPRLGHDAEDDLSEIGTETARDARHRLKGHQGQDLLHQPQ